LNLVVHPVEVKIPEWNLLTKVQVLAHGQDA
jgi:hypothetical protein